MNFGRTEFRPEQDMPSLRCFWISQSKCLVDGLLHWLELRGEARTGNVEVSSTYLVFELKSVGSREERLTLGVMMIKIIIQ